MFRKFKESPYFKAAVTILICGGLLIIFYSWIENRQITIGFEAVNRTLAPVYIGVVLAFILCPVYNYCVSYFYGKLKKSNPEGRNHLSISRALSSIVCTILVVGLIGLLIYFVVPQLIETLIGLGNTMPVRLEALSQWLETHFSRLPQLAKWVDSVANAGTRDILEWTRENVLRGDAVNIANTISSGVFTAVKYVTNALIGLLIMLYLLNYKDQIFAITRKLVTATCGQKRRDSLYEFSAIVNETFIGFIVGRIIDSFIIGVLTFVILKIFSIQFALMISVIVGITNVIPFFGPFIGAIPSVLILMLEEPMQALYFVIIILVIQQLDGNLIGPKIVGDSLGISSFWVLIAVLVGGGLFGFMGMAFGVPVFAVIYRYVNKLTSRSLRYKNKPTRTSDYFSLEPYGIDDDEIPKEGKDNKKRRSFIRYLIKKKGKDKETEEHKRITYDQEDEVSDKEDDR